MATAAWVQGSRDQYTGILEPARALAEALTLERTLSDLVNQACALTPAKIALRWQAGKKLCVHTLGQVWQDRAEMNESDNQFSRTFTASTAGERAPK
jgi:hypothetical protein